jgi:hypothetical protein
LRASARNCLTWFGLIGWGLCGLVAMVNQLDALSVPDVGDECIAPGKPPIELRGRKNSVVDFAAECFFGLANLGGELPLVRPAKDQNVDVACGVGFVFRKRTVDPRGFDALNWPERMPQSRLDANRALQQREDRLEVGIGGVDAVIALAAFGFRAQESLALKAGELAGDIGGIGADCLGQLADIGARGTVDVEQRQQAAAEVGTEGDHCSRIILHLQ